MVNGIQGEIAYSGGLVFGILTWLVDSKQHGLDSNGQNF